MGSGLSGGIDYGSGPDLSGPNDNSKDFAAQAQSYLSGLSSDAIDYANSPAILAWQNKLRLATFLVPGMKILPGGIDDITKTATALVLKKAAADGVSPEDWLDYQIAMNQGSGGGGGKRAPFVPSAYIAPTKKPLDDKVVNLSITDAFEKEFGRAPNEKELNSFRASFRAREQQFFNEEDSAAKSRYNAQEAQRKTAYGAGFDAAGMPQYVPEGSVESGGGVAVGKLPSPDQFTESQLQNSQEAQGYRAAKAGMDILSLMRGGGH